MLVRYIKYVTWTSRDFPLRIAPIRTTLEHHLFQRASEANLHLHALKLVYVL